MCINPSISTSSCIGSNGVIVTTVKRILKKCTRKHGVIPIIVILPGAGSKIFQRTHSDNFNYTPYEKVYLNIDTERNPKDTSDL